MTRYFYVEPEVAGQIGSSTDYDPSVYPPRVTNLEYVFDDWFGDSILESFPCYIVTEQLASKLRAKKLTGFEFDTVRISKSLEFKYLYASKATGPLPKFERLNIVGVAFDDDMGLDIRKGAGDQMIYRFIVSERALTLFRKCGFKLGDEQSVGEVWR